MKSLGYPKQVGALAGHILTELQMTYEIIPPSIHRLVDDVPTSNTCRIVDQDVCVAKLLLDFLPK